MKVEEKRYYLENMEYWRNVLHYEEVNDITKYEEGKGLYFTTFCQEVPHPL